MGNDPWGNIQFGDYDDDDEGYNISHPLDPLGSLMAVVVSIVFIMPMWVWNAALEPAQKGVQLIKADIAMGRIISAEEADVEP